MRAFAAGHVGLAHRLDLYRRHGRDWNSLGVISLRTEWTTQTEKQLMANQTAKLARQLGAQGAVVTWDVGGNEFIEVIRSIQACERLGIKTTSEDDATDGAPTMLEPLPEADAIVSTSFFKNVTLAVPEAPAVARVIGLPNRAARLDHRPARRRGYRAPTALALRRPLRLQQPELHRVAREASLRLRG